MKKTSAGSNEVASYGTSKGFVPHSTRASSSHTKSMNFTTLKNEAVLSPSNRDVAFALKANQNSLNKPPQVRCELALDENAARRQGNIPQKTVSASQALTLTMGSPKGNQKIKVIEEKKATNENSHQQHASISTATTATSTNISGTGSVRFNILSESSTAKRGGLEINTEVSNAKYATVNLGPSTTVARSQTLKPKDLNETNEGFLKKNTVSSYAFAPNTKLITQKTSVRPVSASVSQDKAKLQPQTNNQANPRSSNNQKCHTLEDEQTNPRKDGFFSKFFTKTSPKNVMSSSIVQKAKQESCQDAVFRSQNGLKLTNYHLSSNPGANSTNNQTKGPRVKDGEEESLDVVAQECEAQYAIEVDTRASQNLRQSIQLVRNSVGIRTDKSSFSKDVKSSTLRNVFQNSGKFFEDENDSNSKQQAENGEKVSLHSFVTKVSKGSIFGPGNPIPHRQETESTEKAQKKPSLNLEETAPSIQKPPRSAPSKTPKTTTNSENRVFIFSKNESRVLQNSHQINMSSSQEIRGLSPKSLKLSTPLPRSEETIQAQKQAIMVKAKYPTSFVYHMTSLEKHLKTNLETDYFCQLFREHFNQTYQAMMFVKYLKSADPKAINTRKINLPKRSGYEDKRTIVFDLDETLIHCNESLELPYHIKLPITFPHGDVIEAGINIRPYAVEALRELSQYFEIIVFTASHGCYANVVLDHIDPQGQYIHHRLFRESCVQTEEGIYVKDLRVLANRNLNDVVLVDNAAYSFAYQIDNGIPIAPYYDNPQDDELKHLVAYLKFLNTVRDMQEMNRETFKLNMYAMFESIDKVLDKVILST